MDFNSHQTKQQCSEKGIHCWTPPTQRFGIGGTGGWHDKSCLLCGAIGRRNGNAPTANRFLPLNSAISTDAKRKIVHQKSHYSRRASRSKTRRGQLQAQIWPEPHSYQPSAFAASVSLSTLPWLRGRKSVGLPRPPSLLTMYGAPASIHPSIQLSIQRDHQTGAACSGSWPGRSNRLPSARSSRSCCSSSRPQSDGFGGGAEVEVESPTPAAPLRAPERPTAGSCRASVRPRGCVEAARIPSAAFQDATCADRQRYAREHVSNVQRGGATVTGRPMKPNKPHKTRSCRAGFYRFAVGVA